MRLIGVAGTEYGRLGLIGVVGADYGRLGLIGLVGAEYGRLGLIGVVGAEYGRFGLLIRIFRYWNCRAFGIQHQLSHTEHAQSYVSYLHLACIKSLVN